MTRLIQALHALALALVCAILAPLAYETWHERATFESDVRRASALIGRAEETMKNFKEATDTWKATSEKQTSAILETTYSVNAAAKQLSGFVSKTDESLNSRLLPSLSVSIDQQNAALLLTQKDLQLSLEQTLSAASQLQRTLTAAETVIADPQIKQLIVDLDSNMKQLNLLLQSGTATADDVKRVADKFAEQYTKARNIYYAVFKEVLSVGSQGFQFVLKK